MSKAFVPSGTGDRFNVTKNEGKMFAQKFLLCTYFFICTQTYSFNSNHRCSNSPADCPPGWISDGFCDDCHNTPQGNFDGGDCCGPNVNTDFCSICECFDSTTSTTTATAG